jgi:hypothetical protein
MGAGFFYITSYPNKVLKILFTAGFMIYIMAEFYQIFYLKGLTNSPSFYWIKNIWVSIMSLFCINLLVRSKVSKLKSIPFFWICSGFLFHNFLMLVLNPIFNWSVPVSDDLAFVIGTIKNLLDPILYVIWAYALYVLVKTKNLKPVSSL